MAFNLRERRKGRRKSRARRSKSLGGGGGQARCLYRKGGGGGDLLNIAAACFLPFISSSTEKEGEKGKKIRTPLFLSLYYQGEREAYNDQAALLAHMPEKEKKGKRRKLGASWSTGKEGEGQFPARLHHRGQEKAISPMISKRRRGARNRHFNTMQQDLSWPYSTSFRNRPEGKEGKRSLIWSLNSDCLHIFPLSWKREKRKKGDRSLRFPIVPSDRIGKKKEKLCRYPRRKGGQVRSNSTDRSLKEKREKGGRLDPLAYAIPATGREKGEKKRSGSFDIMACPGDAATASWPGKKGEI